MHVITETDKSQDLLLASWRPRRAGGVGLIRMPTDSRLRKSQCFSSSLKVEKKKKKSQFKGSHAEGVSSYSGKTPHL